MNLRALIMICFTGEYLFLVNKHLNLCALVVHLLYFFIIFQCTIIVGVSQNILINVK